MLMHPREIRETADGLRDRLSAIERGELTATPEQRTFLAGSLAALEGVLADVSTGT